jgi:hypothetical protein
LVSIVCPIRSSSPIVIIDAFIIYVKNTNVLIFFVFCPPTPLKGG